MYQTDSAVLLFYPENEPDSFKLTLKSIIDNSGEAQSIYIIGPEKNNELDKSLNNYKNRKIIFINQMDETLGAQLNRVLEKITSTYLLLIDNRQSPVVLKKGAFELFDLACKRSKNPGLVYGDYELIDKNNTKEVHLLKHHIGRVRDNQDYGKIFYINTKALKNINGADADLKFNTFYDLRLRLSENHEIIHVANRYAGSLYSIKAKGKSQNVFDYLLASKESQLEAEKVLSRHLKNIDAFLEPGRHYMKSPTAPPSNTLKASVIIPVNNRPEFIGTAIESVQAQTIQEIEVIVVVNGGENDTTISIAQRYMPGGDKYKIDLPQVKLLVFEINNIGLCLNMGAHEAKGEYYIQLDSDDRLKPDAVKKILEVYKSDPHIGMVIGSYEVWEKKSDGSLSRLKEIPVVTHDEWTEENGCNNLLRINGAGAPRSIPIELIRKIGFSVNEEPFCRNYGEDYAMVLKISEKHKIGRVWDPIYEVVRHAGGTDHSIDQVTVDRNDEAKDYMRKEAILRRINLNKSGKRD